VVLNWPWRMVDFWSRSRNVEHEHFHVVHREAGSALSPRLSSARQREVAVTGVETEPTDDRSPLPAFDPNLITRANLPDAFRRTAASFGSRLALVDETRSVTHRELHDCINVVARGLLALGVERGDAVALLYRNNIDFFEMFLACARIGAMAVPLNPHLRDEE